MTTDVSVDTGALRGIVFGRYAQLQHTLYENKAEELLEAYGKKDYARLYELLEELPDKKALLEKLYEIVKHKPAGKILKKIAKGQVKSDYELVKGLGCMLTHIAIQLGKGNLEFRMLLPDVYERLGEVLYRMGGASE